MATDTHDTYGVGGLDEVKPARNVIATQTVPVPAERANRATIEAQAADALAANRAFLAIPTPTNAQTLAQVKALTRQNTAMIRLALQLLDGTD